MFVAITIAAAVLAGSALSGHAQRVAVIAPDGDPKSIALAERLSDELRPAFRVVDVSLAASAFASTGLENPYNLATEDAKRVGAVVGSDLFILVRRGSQPRLSLVKGAYHEVFAAIFLASSRTGKRWALRSASRADLPNVNVATWRPAPAARG
jgi:hypothetical protein